MIVCQLQKKSFPLEKKKKKKYNKKVMTTITPIPTTVPATTKKLADIQEVDLKNPGSATEWTIAQVVLSAQQALNDHPGIERIFKAMEAGGCFNVYGTHVEKV